MSTKFKLSTLKEHSTALEMRKALEKHLYEEDFKSSLLIQDDNQHKILTTNSQHCLVTGPAGSGKTILAMIKTNELEKDDKNYCFIVYTKTLKAFLLNKMQQNNFTNPNLKIYYLHEIKKDNYKEFLANCTHIIIDEVQDLSINDLDYLLSNNPSYFLYGDNAQQLYDYGVNIEYINTHLKPTKFHLSRTFRVPKKIAIFAEQIDSHNSNISYNCYNQEGELPQIIEMNGIYDEIIYISEVIATQHWTNTAILLKDNDAVKDFYNEFKSHLNCECKYRINDILFNNLDFRTDNPKIMTYHSAKGLEFDHVFLPSCHNINPTNASGQKYCYREAFFVAITRAKINLIISYIQGNKAPLLNNFKKNTYTFKKYTRR